MSVINNANARNSNAGATPASDFSTVLNNLENAGGQSPLTNTQRADMLRMMHNSSRQGGDNALINSTPPSGPSNFDRQLARSTADLDQLAKLQAEQDKSVQNLTNLLQPLSPSGSIPGIHDNTSLPPPPLDIDDFLNHNEYFTDFPSDGAGNYDFGATGVPDGPQQNFNLADYNDNDELFADLPPTNTEAQQQNGGSLGAYGFDGTDEVKGRVESLASSEATTPNAHVNDEGDGMRTRSARKGRKLSSVDDNTPYKRRKS
jgi:heat shock transcription factor